MAIQSESAWKENQMTLRDKNKYYNEISHQLGHVIGKLMGLRSGLKLSEIEERDSIEKIEKKLRPICKKLYKESL